MAYDAELEDDEKNGQQGSEQVISGQSSQLGQSPGGSNQQQAQSSAPTKSGSWTNLMDYVKANESAGGQMGGQIKSGIQNRANAAEQSAGEFQQRAGERVSQGSVTDSGINKEISSGGAARIQQDAQKRADFDRQYNAMYGGPESASEVEGYANTQNQYNQIQDRAKNAQTNQGREAILRDEYNRPTYTRGEQQLDSFILGASKQGTDALADISQNYSNYASGWDNVVNAVNQGINQGKATTDQTRQATRLAVDQAKATQEAAFKQMLDQANKNRTNQFNDLVRRVERGDASAARELGISLDQMNSVRGESMQFVPDASNVTQFLSRAGNQKIGDLASKDEIANYQALLDLAGLTGSYKDFSSSGEDSYFNFDRAKFMNDYQAIAAEEARRKAEQAARDEAAKKAKAQNNTTSKGESGGNAVTSNVKKIEQAAKKPPSDVKKTIKM